MKSAKYIAITDQISSGADNEAESIISTNRSVLGEAEYQECLGNVHYYRKEFQKALHHYEVAMEAMPDYDCARYHYLLGVQAERGGRLVEAFKRYQAAIEIEPSFVDSYIELGGLLCKTNEYEGALQCFSDALKIDPDDLAIYHNLVKVLSHLAEYDPKSYHQDFENCKLAYERAKQSLIQPKEDRVW